MTESYCLGWLSLFQWMDWKLTLRMISIVPMTNNPINRQLLSKLFISSSSFSLRTDITWIGLSQSMSAQVWPLRASSWHSGPQLQDPYQKIVRQFCLRSSFKLVIWSDGELLKIYRHLLLSVSLVLKNVTYCVFTLKKKIYMSFAPTQRIDLRCQASGNKADPSEYQRWSDRGMIILAGRSLNKHAMCMWNARGMINW